MGGTPLWITITGWAVTVVAGIIPALITTHRQKKMKTDISELRKAVSQSVDKSKFLVELSSLINKLKKYQTALDRGVDGSVTLISLNKLLIRIDSYAKRLNFSEEEQALISSCCQETSRAVESTPIKSVNLTSSDLEKIKLILEKGDKLV